MTAEPGAGEPHGRADRILSRLELLGVKLGLDSTRTILGELGDPQAATPLVLVAGTNGKGSTAAMLSSIATAAGYRTGLYTSPHLERVEERIRIDGREIRPDRLGQLLQRVVEAADRSVGAPPTYFEALTEAAHLHFAEEGIDLAVMETGLGGRLDATNAAEPILSVITEIGLDHTRQLGSTLDRIAREKAGILRYGRPALAWSGAAEASAALGAAARSIGADLAMVDEREPTVELVERGLTGQEVRLVSAGRPYDLSLSLPGRHQLGNLRLAVRASECLAELGWAGIDRTAIERGIADCRWPGRLELVPTPPSPGVLLDAAHNPHAVEALVEFLGQVAPEFDLLFGALEDKQVDRMLPPLARRARRVILTAPDSLRAVSPDALAELLRSDSPAEVVTAPTTAAALESAWSPDGPLLVACGSIYLVGEVRSWLGGRFGVAAAVAGDSAQLGAG